MKESAESFTFSHWLNLKSIFPREIRSFQSIFSNAMSVILWHLMEFQFYISFICVYELNSREIFCKEPSSPIAFITPRSPESDILSHLVNIKARSFKEMRVFKPSLKLSRVMFGHLFFENKKNLMEKQFTHWVRSEFFAKMSNFSKLGWSLEIQHRLSARFWESRGWDFLIKGSEWVLRWGNVKKHQWYSDTFEARIRLKISYFFLHWKVKIDAF